MGVERERGRWVAEGFQAIGMTCRQVSYWRPWLILGEGVGGMGEGGGEKDTAGPRTFCGVKAYGRSGGITLLV